MTAADSPPTVIGLFGATGDLCKRMVIPAFFQLATEGLLPAKYIIVGNGRGDVAHEDFQADAKAACEEFGSVRPKDGPWEEFASRLRFAGGGFSKDDPGRLLDVLAAADEELGGEPERLFYLAVPPSRFGPLTEGFAEHNLTERLRVVYEKPFGTSKESFEELDEAVHKVLDESQIFRIDHFLGKEASQDLHVVRFANGLFAGSWDNKHIAAVQIDVPETLDVADRGGFYDATGATLDMVVTHLVQLLGQVAMEPPKSLEPEDVARSRDDVLGCLRPLDPAEVVLGQYEGYQDVRGVEPGSSMETYIAARAWVDNDRWRGVPFLMRTGKALAASAQRVTVIFRPPAEGPGSDVPDGNALVFSLSGTGSIGLRLLARRPSAGNDATLEQIDAELPLHCVPEGKVLPPYVRLINDALAGDRSLFTRPDGLAQVWEAFMPLLQNKPDPITYKPGSWGPPEADELAEPYSWWVG